MTKNNSLLSQEEIEKFQKEILTWYQKNKRDLPWRRGRDPYHILVSEVMLQQTQVNRVISKYEEWLVAFPTIKSLAKASTRDVLLHWSGLGYNRRALYLKKLAEELVKNYSANKARSSHIRSNNKMLRPTQNDNIVWPQTEKALRQLPGIGEYTAAALLCFAFDQQVAVIDTNIRKVILVHFKHVIPDLIRDLDSRFRGNDKEKIVIEQIANALLPKGKAYDWNQALMDYASAELKKEKISIPKQSKFKDSDRYYRGQIIKYLITHKKAEIAVFEALFAGKVTPERLQKIIQRMCQDNLIQQKRKYIVFSE